MSNLSKADDVPGTHFWLIRKLWTDRNGWNANLFVSLNEETGGIVYVGDHLIATKFKTRDDAEKAAFSITIKSPDLIQKLKVELM
jgi:hypothetical protein